MAKATRKAAKKEDTSTIFGGPALTMQQREAIKRQEKADKKARLQEQRRRARAATKKAKNPQDAKQATVLILALIALVVLGAVMLLLTNGSIGRQAKPNMTYFIDEAVIAEKSADGVTAAITQAYYTKNGGMYMHLSFANGMPVSQHPTRIYIKLMNEAGEVITEAAVGNIPRDYFVIYGGYDSYDIFIPKKYIKIPDDSLASISYEITIESEDKE